MMGRISSRMKKDSETDDNSHAKQRKVNSIEDFVRCIVELNKSVDECGCILHYRGLYSADYELLPSIARNNQDVLNIEKRIIDEAVNEMPELFYGKDSPMELLALLQHYGVPTRLLDITDNPLVALYFACKNDNDGEDGDKGKDVDGEVIVFGEKREDWRSINFNQAFYETIADTYNFVTKDKFPIRCALRNATSKLYLKNDNEYKKICEDIENEKFDDTESMKAFMQVVSKVKYVSAPKISDRQKNQNCGYILFSNKVDEDSLSFTNEIQPIGKEDSCIKKRITVSKDCKEEILRYLNVFGVTERYIFPDKYTWLKNQIKNKYMNSNEN